MACLTDGGRQLISTTLVGGATARRGDGTGRAIVDLYEYQGRDCSSGTACPCSPAASPTTPEEARAIAERLGGRVVVKAQVKVGGRGKAGGVKLADGADEAVARATDILGMDIKGHTVHKVMLTETADIAEEYYFSYLLDRANRTFLCIASVAGGMEIEQVAAETPDKVAKVADRRQRRASTRRRPARSSPPPASRPRSPTRSSTSRSSCGRPSSPRTPRWSR